MFRNPLAVYRPIACHGAYVFDWRERTVHRFIARHTVLATGGLGLIFGKSTNSSNSTGAAASQAPDAEDEPGDERRHRVVAEPHRIDHPCGNCDDVSNPRRDGTLALAVVALIAVLPEYSVDMYFTWQAGRHEDSEYARFAIANMTGANRLIIGVAWAVVAVICWLKPSRHAASISAI